MKDFLKHLTLVFVHGWGCRPSDFDAVIAHLNEDHGLHLRTLAPTLPGHGKGGEQEWKPTIPDFAQFVLDFCLDQELETVVLVGHSMGVRIIPEVWSLLKHEEKARAPLTQRGLNVKGLVFLDGSSFKLASLGDGDGSIAQLNNSQLEALVSGGFSARTPQAFRNSTVQHVLAMNKTYRDALWDNIIDYDVKAAEETLRLLGKEGGIDVFSLQATYISEEGEPASLKKGEESQYMRYLKGLVPGIRQEVVEGSGHYLQVDRAECVADRLSKHLAEMTD